MVVRALNGNVILQGTVDTASDKEKLEKEVRGMDGVKSVTNQVMIQDKSARQNTNGRIYTADPTDETTSGDPRKRAYTSADYDKSNFATADSMRQTQDSASTSADEQLNKKIRDKFSQESQFRDITLNTTNGVVTIRGTVGSENEQQRLMSEIQKMNGVKEVRSNLSIR